MSYQQEKFKEIADAIREKTGESELIKPSDFAGKVDEVYDAGKHQVFEMVQQGGNRKNYYHAFYGWKVTPENFRPIYDIKPTSMQGAFYGTVRGQAINLKECGVEFDFSECTTFYQAFDTGGVEVIGTIDATKVVTSNEQGLYQMFRAPNYENAIRWIDKFIVAEETDKFWLTFQLAGTLEHCVFEGTIAKNGLDLSACKLIDKESLLSVIDCLKDYSEDTSGETHSASIGTTNLTKLTDAEKAAATEKGWSLT